MRRRTEIRCWIAAGLVAGLAVGLTPPRPPRNPAPGRVGGPGQYLR
ncbi:hypothetical protein [Phytohabitans kaempferiae]|uniref:Uncharacterized protein n=1 Tax=Phytohabitans kaempferiae TaxID=1620943 RepID=A0ABV6MG53_9ACTN